MNQKQNIHSLNLNDFNIIEQNQKIKYELVDNFKIYNNIVNDNELLNKNINIIQQVDIINDGLEIFINNYNCKYNEIKKVLKEKLNKTNTDCLYIQFFKINDRYIHFQTYNLNNEERREIINNLLTKKFI